MRTTKSRNLAEALGGWATGARTQPMAALDVLVRSLQEKAWRLSEIKDRLEDPGFPFSGRFDPPAEIEEAIARLLVLTGTAAGRPTLSGYISEPMTPMIFEADRPGTTPL